MNKRLIALFLCLVMMLSVFLTGCAEDSEEAAKNELEEAKVASNMTLTMWVVSESPVSDSARNDVTKAINALTKAKYKTQLEIYYLSEAEYFEKLTTAMEAFEATKKTQNANKPVQTGTTNTEETGTTIEEIVTDEHGMYRDNYPIVLQNQVDIIYIGDVEGADGSQMSGQLMYNKLRAGDWLAPLDESIKGDAKKLKEFISPTLLSAVQEKGVTYAIPNNNVIGEYTFMCLNKALIEKYSMKGYLTRGAINSFANEYVYQFIDQIARYESDDLIPIGATYEECLEHLAYYWNINPEDYSIDSDEFSIFGTPLFGAQPSRGQSVVGVQSLFENEEFTKHYLALNEYRLEKKYRFDSETMTEDTSKEIVFFKDETTQDESNLRYGVKFVDGTLDIVKPNTEGNYVYKDESGVEYYAVPVSYPTATADDIYSNMFAVAKTTLSVERSMQIITYLNTNVEMRNLLQYGIEEKHYLFDKDGNVKRNDENKYEMDIYATGNTFIAYREPGMDASIWENGKKQNRDSLVEPLLGFNLAEYAQTATQFGIPITVTNTKTYSTSFRSGLNKEILSQDPVLGAWLEACDADAEEKGQDGVYVFRSREKTPNNEYSEILYFYNTAGAYRFGVESEEVAKDSGTGYYRNNTYTYTEDSKLTEYEKERDYTLTMVYDICMARYEGTYKVVQKELNSKGAEVSRTELPHIEVFVDDFLGKYKEQTYDFDLYETDSYKLNVYGDLYFADFYDNKAIFNKIVELQKNIGSNQANLGFFWKDESSSQTKNYYSFILYRANITHTTLIDVVPTVSNDGDKINLVINYNEYLAPANKIENPSNYGESGVRPGKTYMLYYVTLETDKGIELETYLTEDGEEKCTPIYNLSQTTKDELETGPLVHEFGEDMTALDLPNIGEVDFKAYGMLNTEAVKYMAELNDIVMELLDSCTNIADLKQMVKYLSRLLNTEKELISVHSNFPEINKNNPAAGVDANFMKFVADPDSIVYEKNFKELFYQLTHITNHGTMEEVLGSLRMVLEIKDEYRPIFYSPYGIYYLWMEAYQYLPTNMQPTK